MWTSIVSDQQKETKVWLNQLLSLKMKVQKMRAQKIDTKWNFYFVNDYNTFPANPLISMENEWNERKKSPDWKQSTHNIDSFTCAYIFLEYKEWEKLLLTSG